MCVSICRTCCRELLTNAWQLKVAACDDVFQMQDDLMCAFLRTKIPPPGILLSTYQWKEGYLVILSYIYAYARSVLPQYPELFRYVLCGSLCKLLFDTWDLLKPFYFPHPFINTYNSSISYIPLQGNYGILLHLLPYLLHFRHFIAFITCHSFRLTSIQDSLVYFLLIPLDS